MSKSLSDITRTVLLSLCCCCSAPEHQVRQHRERCRWSQGEGTCRWAARWAGRGSGAHSLAHSLADGTGSACPPAEAQGAHPSRAAPNPGQNPQDTATHPVPPHSHLSSSFLPNSTLQTALSEPPPSPGCHLGAVRGRAALGSPKGRVPSTRLKTENCPGCPVLP